MKLDMLAKAFDLSTNEYGLGIDDQLLSLNVAITLAQCKLVRAQYESLVLSCKNNKIVIVGKLNRTVVESHCE